MLWAAKTQVLKVPVDHHQRRMYFFMFISYVRHAVQPVQCHRASIIVIDLVLVIRVVVVVVVVVDHTSSLLGCIETIMRYRKRLEDEQTLLREVLYTCTWLDSTPPFPSAT
jgi:uncharacterized membrane protein YpjA